MNIVGYEAEFGCLGSPQWGNGERYQQSQDYFILEKIVLSLKRGLTEQAIRCLTLEEKNSNRMVVLSKIGAIAGDNANKLRCHLKSSCLQPSPVHSTLRSPLNMLVKESGEVELRIRLPQWLEDRPIRVKGFIENIQFHLSFMESDTACNVYTPNVLHLLNLTERLKVTADESLLLNEMHRITSPFEQVRFLAEYPFQLTIFQ